MLPAGAVVPSASPAAATADTTEDGPGSVIEAFGMNVAARGAEAYKSCKFVRPRAITGLVA